MVAMMGCLSADKGWRKGPWTGDEDKLLCEYVSLYGEGRWSSVAKFTGIYVTYTFITYIMNYTAPTLIRVCTNNSEKQGDEYNSKGSTHFSVFIYMGS